MDKHFHAKTHSSLEKNSGCRQEHIDMSGFNSPELVCIILGTLDFVLSELADTSLPLCPAMTAALLFCQNMFQFMQPLGEAQTITPTRQLMQQISDTFLPLWIFTGGMTSPTALAKVSIVEVSPCSLGTVQYWGMTLLSS